VLCILGLYELFKKNGNDDGEDEFKTSVIGVVGNTQQLKIVTDEAEAQKYEKTPEEKVEPVVKTIKKVVTVQTKPAKEVGGDLYDFFMRDNKLYFIIGDVSGKGVPASLIMAVTCRLFRLETIHFDAPAAIVSSLNNSLAETNESNMFVTFFLGILDLDSGRLRYCNAGHNAPLLLTEKGEISYMDVKPNLPLGLFADFPYEEEEVVLDKKSTLFMYTDGVTEAENVKSELFSEERLLQLLKQTQKKNIEDLVHLVLEEVRIHAGEKEQSDDITMLGVTLNLDR
jgi:sigma-B regulation protein RsbU (phosphoserine phosphatase)